MPLATCLRCNKMFNKVQSSVCLSCQPDEDADHERVREVLDEEMDLKPDELAEKAGVDIAVVRRMVQDGLVVQVSALEPPVCGKCGAPAISHSKKLCQGCLDKLNAEVSKAQANIKLSQRKPPQVGGFLNAREAFERKRK